MNMDSPVSINWSHLYSPANIKLWQLPAVGNTEVDSGVFRELVLDWSKLPDRTSTGDDLPAWVLCCDVLVLREDVVLTQSAFVFARRIEVFNGASLILDRLDGNTQTLIIFTQETVDGATGRPIGLEIRSLFGEEEESSHRFEPDAENKGVSGFLWEGEGEVPEEISQVDLESEWLMDGEPLRLALITEFQLATLLSTDNPALSIAQLRWIASLAQASKDTLDLSSQAGSLAMTLLSIQATGDNALLVPQLDLDIYASKAEACMELLRQRQTLWENYQNRLANDEHWAESALAALETQQNQEELAERLEKQALDTRNQVVYARDIAAKQVLTEKALLVERKFAFDAGIKIWKREETAKAVIDLVLGITKILSQIPTVVAAGPQMAMMPAVESAQAVLEIAAKGVQSIMSSESKKVEEIEMQELDANGKAKNKKPQKVKAEVDKETRKERAEAQAALVEGLKQAGEGGKEVYDAAMKIMNIAAMAESMEATSREILGSTDETIGEGFSSYEVQGLDVVTGGEQEWKLLSEAIENTFEQISILGDIDGGTAYRLEIRRLIVYGQALSQARLAMAKANAQLAEMKMRRVAAIKAVAIAERRLKKLSDQINQDQTVSQLIFGRVLDAKRAIYLAMEMVLTLLSVASTRRQ